MDPLPVGIPPQPRPVYPKKQRCRELPQLQEASPLADSAVVRGAMAVPEVAHRGEGAAPACVHVERVDADDAVP